MNFDGDGDGDGNAVVDMWSVLPWKRRKGKCTRILEKPLVGDGEQSIGFLLRSFTLSRS